MTHVTSVVVDLESVRRGGTTRTAACACGWTGPQRGTMELAADDALSHERGAPTYADPGGCFDKPIALEIAKLSRQAIKEGLKGVRIHAKPIRFHRNGCRFDYTATCTCGQEPNYSPAARVSRGEIYSDGTVRRADDRDPGDEDRRGA